MLLASTLLYPAFMFLGISVCTLLAVPRMRSQIARQPSQGQVFWGIATMTALAVIGSRIDFAFSEAFPAEQCLSSLTHSEGVSLNGLLLGGYLSLMLHCRVYHLNTAAFLDVLFPAVMVGIGVSRFGCYFNGCCYGHPTRMPWGCTFPPGTDAYRNMLIEGFVADNASHTVRLHPTQIYSAATCLGVGSLAWQLFRFRKFDGQIASVTLAAGGTAGLSSSANVLSMHACALRAGIATSNDACTPPELTLRARLVSLPHGRGPFAHVVPLPCY
ncbi:prolipoprotein diacylglyceryl transferase family protein [Maioricimonas sp. JC845]|uniref:prolipoprotein diacylglyceryl transferase family protein n=1 Tax=Maioricimonas sp. JC845 TaxID=3232138 RepID=UPI00345A5E62